MSAACKWLWRGDTIFLNRKLRNTLVCMHACVAGLVSGILRDLHPAVCWAQILYISCDIMIRFPSLPLARCSAIYPEYWRASGRSVARRFIICPSQRTVARTPPSCRAAAAAPLSSRHGRCRPAVVAARCRYFEPLLLLTPGCCYCHPTVVTLNLCRCCHPAVAATSRSLL